MRERERVGEEAPSNGMVRKGLLKGYLSGDLEVKGAGYGSSWRERVLGREPGKCKSPKAGMNLACVAGSAK